MEEENNEEEIKIIFLHDVGVGTTNIIQVAVGNSFNPNSPLTTCAYFEKKNIFL